MKDRYISCCLQNDGSHIGDIENVRFTQFCDKIVLCHAGRIQRRVKNFTVTHQQYWRILHDSLEPFR